MQLIRADEVQARIDSYRNEQVYLHLETTAGAYAAHFDSSRHQASVYITNASVRFSQGAITGENPYRIGLKMEQGWIYAEGLTHMDEQDAERLILAGHDQQGRLVVALQLSRIPF